MHLAEECPKRVVECVFCQDEFYFIKKQVWLPALKSTLKPGFHIVVSVVSVVSVLGKKFIGQI